MEKRKASFFHALLTQRENVEELCVHPSDIIPQLSLAIEEGCCRGLMELNITASLSERQMKKLAFAIASKALPQLQVLRIDSTEGNGTKYVLEALAAEHVSPYLEILQLPSILYQPMSDCILVALAQMLIARKKGGCHPLLSLTGEWYEDEDVPANMSAFETVLQVILPSAEEIDRQDFGNFNGKALHLLASCLESTKAPALLNLNVGTPDNLSHIVKLAKALSEGAASSLRSIRFSGTMFDLTAMTHLAHAVENGAWRWIEKCTMESCYFENEEVLAAFGRAMINASCHLRNLVNLSLSTFTDFDDDLIGWTKHVCWALRDGACPQLQHLCVDFDDNSLMVLAEALQIAPCAQSLVSLEVDGFWRDWAHGMIELTKIIKEGVLPNLAVLNMFDSVLPPLVVVNLSNSLKQSSLSQSLISLSLPSCNISKKGVQYLAKAMKNSGGLPSLETLNVADNQDADDEGVASLIEALGAAVCGDNFIKLDVSGTGANFQSMRALVRAMEEGPLSNLEDLDLEDNDINDEAMACLVEGFQKGVGASISTVCLHMASVKETSIHLLASALQEEILPQLQCLTLTGFVNGRKGGVADQGVKAERLLRQAFRASGRDRQVDLSIRYAYMRDPDEDDDDSMDFDVE